MPHGVSLARANLSATAQACFMWCISVSLILTWRGNLGAGPVLFCESFCMVFSGGEGVQTLQKAASNTGTLVE